MGPSEIATLVMELLLKNLPLALFILSIIISGNIIRIILFSKDFKDHEYWKFKIDVISITFGLIINFTSLASLSIYEIGTFIYYMQLTTWLRIGIVTAIFMVSAWKYRSLGNKWLKDTVVMLISILLGIAFLAGGISFVPELIDIQSFLACKGVFCWIGLIVKKILFLLLVIFLFYAGFKLLKEAKKERRYKRKIARNE